MKQKADLLLEEIKSESKLPKKIEFRATKEEFERVREYADQHGIAKAKVFRVIYRKGFELFFDRT